MSSEFERAPEADAKDRTPLLWIAVVLLIAAMLAVVWLLNRDPATRSRVRVSQILIKFDAGDPADRERALELARSLREQLVEGASFARLAKEYSGDKWSAARGGDLGWRYQGELVPLIEEYAWSAPIGQVSEVLPASYGYHIAVVYDRQISDVDRYEKELHDRVGAPSAN
ncbi:MAG: peptidylprolyl isomerase [Candidatus Hydrogenedentales bacterium]